ncbi:MAG: TetR/AcrR family transcriptional regulator [Chloroflexi bacterium]|nr:TetR/AcrR family transcriptional regulator [Chloroflexota bacterium]
MSREAILESAAQVIRQKGFHAASMADIAEAVQLQKASLYHHFSSKQDILLELLDRALDMVIEGMAGVMAQNLPADQKLRVAVRLYLKTLSEQGDLVSVLLMEHRSLDPEYHSKHIPHRDRFEQMWRELIQEGADTGVFIVENIPLTTRGLMGVMNWTITWYKPDGALSIDQIADHFTDLFLTGLKK